MRLLLHFTNSPAIHTPLSGGQRGNYVITLPAAKCDSPYGCVVGGAPWILVETFTP